MGLPRAGPRNDFVGLPRSIRPRNDPLGKRFCFLNRNSESLSQLFEAGEYAKLSLDEKNLSHPRDDRNRFSPSL